MYFEIDVNVARRGAEPIWRSLRDDSGICVWYAEEEARAALAAEGRGSDARLMRVDAVDGHRRHAVS